MDNQPQDPSKDLQPTPEAINPEPKEPTVTLTKDQFNQLIQQNTNLATELGSLRNTIKGLEFAADKSRIEAFNNLTAGPRKMKVRLRTFRNAEGKLMVVIGWKSLANETYKDFQTGQWKTDQRIEVILEDASKIPLQYIDFDRFTHAEMQEAEVIGKELDDEGNLQTLKVRRIEDGAEYTIGAAYVN